MSVWDTYQSTILFAAAAHKGQCLPSSDITYVVHLSNVAMEVIMAHKAGASPLETFDLETAVRGALLHDTLEDTAVSFEELEKFAGARAASMVAALSKDKTLPKEKKLQDSIERIKKCGIREAAVVKLADRITNLQKPPAAWSADKMKKYREEAYKILENLGYANEFLAARLALKIEEYRDYYE
ncbi:MAG TPA: bifunctional (p)ppGpp synthetase/guanosine-3',5'-bis(diphosphate) 3'-pyrophosphohydrolase [Candidatus Wallbacteria bacterium]|nr:bifunctional (p)ppGpp synthetase/guanosine-3',5'-bis(diphosphate) 3'-pyrophosphohydrolase [Candidatus Wallbacteria bacterium]